MKRHDLHFHTQEDTDHAVVFLREHVSPTAMTVDEDKISFTTERTIGPSLQSKITKGVNTYLYAFNLTVEESLPITTTIDQEQKSFTDRDKAMLRKLLLDLIFSEPEVKHTE